MSSYRFTASKSLEWIESQNITTPDQLTGRQDRQWKNFEEALRKMLDKRSDQAELSQPVTWHDFRRTFAGNLWDAKIDGVTIQKLMGHASQNQTAKYDRRPDTARRQAVKVLHVPYRHKIR
jgi:integrase